MLVSGHPVRGGCAVQDLQFWEQVGVILRQCTGESGSAKIIICVLAESPLKTLVSSPELLCGISSSTDCRTITTG